jgi:hypothetical protein
MEIGIYSFAETRFDPETGRQIDADERIRHLLEEVQLADEVGLDVFGLGEHHRPDYAVSTPAVVLGAAAARTRRIRLTSAVSVLSSDDPVRVFQDFATLDLISGGRRSCSPRSWSSCSRSAPLSGCPGREDIARPSTTEPSIPDPCRIPSRCGSPSAALPIP